MMTRGENTTVETFSTGLRGIALFFVLISLTSYSYAQTSNRVTWNWGNAALIYPNLPPRWDFPQCWSPEVVPQAGDVAHVTSYCEYYRPLPVRTLLDVLIAGFADGVVLIHEGGDLFTNSIHIGGSSSYGNYGRYKHSGGRLITDRLWLDGGASDQWIAFYEMSGSAELFGYDGTTPTLALEIGDSGKGRFNQSGGAVTADVVNLGSHGTGYYVMTGGELTANRFNVGGYGIGLLEVSAGTININTATQITANNIGRIDLSGTARFLSQYADLTIARNGTGTMTQSDNAELVVHNLVIGEGATGSYRLYGGRVDATNIYVGKYGEGSMLQSEGTLIVYGGLYVGKGNGAAGRFQWEGGFLGADVTMATNGTFALARSFDLADFDSISGPLFQGSIAGLDRSTFEVTNYATATVSANDAFSCGTLLLGSEDGPGRLSLNRGTFSVGDILSVAPYRSDDFEGIDALTGIRAQVYGRAAGQFGQLLGSGTATAQLDGTLLASCGRLFAFLAGDTVDLLTNFDTISGEFSNVAVEGVDKDFEFEIEYDHVNGRVRLIALTDSLSSLGRVEHSWIDPEGVAFLGGGTMATYGVEARFTEPPEVEFRGYTGQVPIDVRDGVLPPIPEELIPEGMREIQYWDLSVDGGFNGVVDLTFCYDDIGMAAAGINEGQLVVHHFDAANYRWEQLDTLLLDTENNLIGVETDSLSPFFIGIAGSVPELEIFCPPDATVFYGDSVSPSILGEATTNIECTVQYSDAFVPGCGDSGKVIRTWSAALAPYGSDACQQIIHVQDDGQAPVIISLNANNLVVPIDTPVFFAASYTDSYGAPHVGSWDFDGDLIDDAPASVTEPQGAATGSMTGAHTYAESGVYNVRLTASDDCGNMSLASLVIVAYDPSAGFATGGGWFVPDDESHIDGIPVIDLASRAQFGFVVKYKKGADSPDGSLEFQYKAADLNLISTDMDWLVVQSNSKVRFKGTANINGAGPYTFKVTAEDNGEPGTNDTFQIEIWMGKVETENNSSSPKYKAKGKLGGGNIQIKAR